MSTSNDLSDVFATHGVRTDLASGEVVIRAGEPGSGLVRIVAGRLGLDVPHRDRSLRVAEVGPGTVLGSISLLAGGSPTATATALEPSVVEVVATDDGRAWVAEHPALAQRLTADARAALDRDTLLHTLADLLDAPDAELAEVSRALPVRAVRAGEVVCAAGDEDRTAFLVLGGRVSIRSGERELARVGRGALLGEMALLTGEPRSATVTALRDSVVAALDEAALRKLAADHPAVAREVFSRLAEAARRTGAGRLRERTPVSTIAVGSVTDRVNTRVLLTRMVDTLSAFGSTRQVSAAVVDRDLQIPGASAATGDDPAAARLASWLREQESAHDHLLLEFAPDVDAWTRRAVRVADRVMVVVSADPSDTERDRVRALVQAVPDTTTVVAVLDHPPGTEQPTGTASLRDDLGVGDVLHVRDGSVADLARAARLVAGRGTALVLGGGGARGFAHLGVHRALTEAGVPVDLLVGASIGTPMAGALAHDLGPQETIDVARRLFAGLLDYTIPVTSLIKGERITAAIAAFFGDEDIEDTWIPFRCVSTNLTHSRTEVHARGPVAPAVRASVAIPGVMPPVPSGDDLLVDGGVLDNLPVDVAAADGRCETIIAVDVAPPTGPRATGDYGLSVSGWQALRASVRKGRSEFPGITAVLMRSVIVGSIAQRDQALEAAEVDLLLELHIRGVGLLEFEKVDPVVEQGIELARPEIEAWLARRRGDAVAAPTDG